MAVRISKTLAFFCIVGGVIYWTQPSAAERAEQKRQGKHCLSPWSGAHNDLVDAVKKDLRDPHSFEHAGTMVTAMLDNGRHLIEMRYRAKNGFGGMEVAKAIGTFKNDDCSVVEWSSVQQ